MVAALGVRALKEEAFDLVGRVERITFLLVEIGRKSFQEAANISAIRFSTFIDYIAEDEHLAGTKHISWRPIERTPVNSQPQIALSLCSEAANGRAVEGEIVPALEQELLVVIEHVQPAFEVAEQHGYSLYSRLVGQIFESLFPNLVSCNPVISLLFGF